jgi:hypothetical protein
MRQGAVPSSDVRALCSVLCALCAVCCAHAACCMLRATVCTAIQHSTAQHSTAAQRLTAFRAANRRLRTLISNRSSFVGLRCDAMRCAQCQQPIAAIASQPWCGCGCARARREASEHSTAQPCHTGSIHISQTSRERERERELLMLLLWMVVRSAATVPPCRPAFGGLCGGVWEGLTGRVPPAGTEP